MKLEVLLATIDQVDDRVIDSIGVASDILVCNQTSTKTDYRKYIKNRYQVRWYDFQERGVGLNRNNALFRSEADICLLTDDDVAFEKDYAEIVLSAFENNPQADVILFNIYLLNGKKKSNKKKKLRIHKYNCGQYGAVQIAFRRMSIIKNAIAFNQLFGGGCKYSAGEDIIFIQTCLRKGLHIIAVPDCILRLTDLRPSTWFDGHNQKFYEDFGAGYYCNFGLFAVIVTFVQLIRRRKKMLDGYPFWRAWRYALNGIKKYREL